MAGVKRCLGVDIGSHSVKIAEMAVDRGGIRIVRLVSGPVSVGPTAQDAERAGATVSAIRNLIKTNKITTKNAVFSIPGQTVVVRHGQRLPRAPLPRLAQIIQIEARQLILFPPDQRVLEYQVFDTEDAREVEVLLVAMKKDANQEFMRLVRRTGLRPVAICPTHLALYNGQEVQRFTREQTESLVKRDGGLFGLSLGTAGGKNKAAKPKKGKKTKGKGAPPSVEEEAAAPVKEEEPESEELQVDVGAALEEVRAYVNIGARTTDLAISQAAGRKTVGFTRSIPIGSSHMTAAILRNCQCDSFTQAEQIKIERTAALSGMFELEADASRYDRRACEAATQICDRIIAELRRSLDYFISQPLGVAVDSIVLSGGGAQLPYLASYIEERLGLPVDASKTLNNEHIKTPSQYTEGFDFSIYRVALGLAIQGLGISPITVDFLPSDVRAMRDFSAQGMEVAILAALVAAMVFFSSQIGEGTMRAYRQDIAQYDDFIGKRKPIRVKQEGTEAARKKVVERINTLNTALAPRDFWLRFYADIQRLKPPEVLILQIQPTPDWNNPLEWGVSIAGQSEQIEAATNFATVLTNSPYVKKASFRGYTPLYSTNFKKQSFQFEIAAQVQDTGLGLLTRLMPELTPTPMAVTAGRFPGLGGMGPMSPEQLRMMIMMGGMPGMPGMPGVQRAPGTPGKK